MDLETPTEARQARRSEEVIHIAIRLVLLAGLIYWSFVLLSPFIPILLWSVILAVALYPAYDWLAVHLGYPRIAAILVTLAVLAVFLGPAAWLGIGLVEGLRNISDQLTSGNLTIPTPPDSVKSWPVIGASLFDYWQMASTNLESAFREVAPYLKPLAGPVLAIAGSAGTGTLMFLVGVIISGFLF